MSDPEPSGPFPNWDDPTWDRPIRLLDAIKLWSPEFGSRLCKVLDKAGEVSVDEIRRTAEQRRQREAGADGAVNATPDADGGPSDREIPASLRDDFLRLPRQWPHLNQTDRLAVATELAGRLIIAKTKHGEPFLLVNRPSASRGGWDTGHVTVDDAAHLSLGPFDFDLRNSLVRDLEQNWLSVRVASGGATEGQQMRVTRLAREEKDSAAASAWALERKKPMRDRQFFWFDEIADELAWNPRSLEVEGAKRGRVLLHLERCIRQGQFDLTGESEVVTLIGEPPHFVPLAPVGPDEILVDPEGLILRRTACRRYLLNSALECAPQLLMDWFPEDVQQPLSVSGKTTAPDAADISQMPNADQRNELTKQQPPLRGKALAAALEKWARNSWGKDLSRLPPRDELLRAARDEFGNHISQLNIRALRKLAPAKIRHGGSPTHRYKLLR